MYSAILIALKHWVENMGREEKGRGGEGKGRKGLNHWVELIHKHTISVGHIPILGGGTDFMLKTICFTWLCGECSAFRNA